MDTEKSAYKKIYGYEVMEDKGEVDSLIVSISGIGNPELDRMLFELGGVFSKLNRRDHVIFLRDTRRSWFNDVEGYEDLLLYIRGYIQENEIKNVILIGMSMGGSGAIILAKDLLPSHTICINPQIFIGAGAAPWDPRYVDLWGKIAEINHPNLAKYLPHIGRCTIVASLDDIYDARQILFIDGALPEDVSIYGIRSVHNVGQHLKQHGSWEDFVEALLNNKCSEVMAGPTAYNEYRSMILKLLDNPRGDWPEIVYQAVVDGAQPLPYHLFSYFQEANRRRASKSPIESDGRVDFKLPLAIPMGELDLSKSGILTSGWSAPSSYGSWAVGREHRIAFRIPDRDYFGEVTLKLIFTSIGSIDCAEQSYTVHVGGDVVCAGAAIFSEVKPEYFSIPVTIDGDQVDILIVTPDAVSPKELGLNNDERLLSLRLKQVVLTGNPLRVSIQ